MKMLLQLFISYLQIPGLVSVFFHNNYVVTGVSVYIKNNAKLQNPDLPHLSPVELSQI